MKITCLPPLCVCLHCLFSFTAGAQTTQPGRLHGYVGGPYKIAIADLTGDKLPDIMLGYHQMGGVAVWQSDGRGGLTLAANNMFGDEDRELNPNDETWAGPHIHNLCLSDIDADGLFLWTWLGRDAWQGRTWDGGMVFAGNGSFVPSRRWELWSYSASSARSSVLDW